MQAQIQLYRSPSSPRFPRSSHVGEKLGTKDKINICLDLLLHEFQQPHNIPWVVCFSGGKDSTLLLQMVFEIMQKLKTRSFCREVHIVANDTLVESPLVAKHLDKNLNAIKKYVKQKNWQNTIKVKKTHPKSDQTFWVNLIGKGYASPTRIFRWCTNRLKIEPTSGYIKEQVDKNGQVIVLLGVRSAESSGRAATAAKYTVKDSHLHPHTSLKNCMVFRPILDLTNDELWAVLLQRKPPWGGSHRELITLYRNALGGECPIVTDISDAPSCGSKSPRFGCWTCTVVNKDRSLEGLVDAGFEDLEPLVDFRNYLAKIRTIKSMRMERRRNGALMKRKDGSIIRGPFTIRARKEILTRLEQLQTEIGSSIRLISEEEKCRIKEIWDEDKWQYARRGAFAMHANKGAN